MKQVLLIGDSIRQGYCEYVKEALKDRAQVVYPLENCRSSQNIIMSMAGWSTLVCEREKVEVVHFNCGQWDASHLYGDVEPLTSLEEYKKKIRAIVLALKKFFPNAKIVFATTTPMNPLNIETENPRTTEDIIRYNDAALQVLKEFDVDINDLFAVSASWNEEYFIDYCHLTEQGYQILGERVSKFLQAYL